METPRLPLILAAQGPVAGGKCPLGMHMGQKRGTAMTLPQFSLQYKTCIAEESEKQGQKVGCEIHTDNISNNYNYQRTNTAATLKPVIMQGTEFSRMEWKSINFMKKLVQIQTDIIFLSKCKQMDITPKGLKVKNPLQSTYYTDYADSLCHTLSKKLRNHLINILYGKQGKIKNELSKVDKLIKKKLPKTFHTNFLVAGLYKN
ncbi:hypothetical protein UY3_15288 [Chelonia mydas]|uniref:Uncharacterized protein n=1 Tax=Chelonia mydas TaxID=8469 RepID=M7AX12_CHEMY|nr:hypothetical protein UY3_15288 [Chelonia mydas]